MTLTLGARLGPYEVTGQIGAGGMGEVYRARDPRLGRDVAIKVLPAAFSSDPDRLYRFEQEARAAAALNHPNILAVYDIGTNDGAPYIVSELLDGDTLRARLTRPLSAPAGHHHPESTDSTPHAGPLPLRKAIDYAAQIVRGLAAAHDKNIVHRDLKPENVFVSSDGRVKVLDFGLAKLTERAAAAAGAGEGHAVTVMDTQPGLLLGTIGYMAPEQARGLAVDHRGDIFSFGAILYEMLTGCRAFRGDTPADTITAILDKEPIGVPALEPRVPTALARIVDRCLEKNPTARFQSTHDLAFALDALGTQSESSAAGAKVPANLPSWRARWWLIGAAAAVLAVAAMTPFYMRSTTTNVARPTRFAIPIPPDLQMATPNAAATSLSISPDGGTIAFVGSPRAGGPPTLWIRPLDALEARTLPGTDGASYPFWSPDSRAIGFFSEGKLKKINLSGGGAQVVCDAGAQSAGGTWNHDGTIVFSLSSVSALFRVSAAGGQAVAVTTLDASRNETSHRWPVFLPDGNHFLFFATPDATVHVGALNPPDRRRLLSADSKALYSPTGHLLFTRLNTLFAQRFDVAHLQTVGDPVQVAEQVGAQVGIGTGSAAFSVSDTGVLTYRTGILGVYTGQLTWFDRNGRATGTIGRPGDYRGIELSPDGRRLLVHPHDLNGGGDLWVMDLAREASSRLTFGGHATGAIWSPDGSRIAFGSNRPASGPTLPDPYAGVFNFFEKRADNTGDPTLLLDAAAAKHTPSWKEPMSWSPDGQFIVYEAWDPKTLWDLWALPLSGERRPRRVVSSEFEEIEGQISPDGRWLAYTSDETKRWEVFMQPLSGTGKYQISTTGGRLPRWRADSKELFYIALDSRLTSVQVDARGNSFDYTVPRPLFETTIAPIFLQANPIAATAKTPFPYVVSRDGQRFLIVTDASRQRATETPITVVLSWQSALEAHEKR